MREIVIKNGLKSCIYGVPGKMPAKLSTEEQKKHEHSVIVTNSAELVLHKKMCYSISLGLPRRDRYRDKTLKTCNDETRVVTAKANLTDSQKKVISASKHSEKISKFFFSDAPKKIITLTTTLPIAMPSPPLNEAELKKLAVDELMRPPPVEPIDERSFVQALHEENDVPSGVAIEADDKAMSCMLFKCDVVYITGIDITLNELKAMVSKTGLLVFPKIKQHNMWINLFLKKQHRDFQHNSKDVGPTHLYLITLTDKAYTFYWKANALVAKEIQLMDMHMGSKHEIPNFTVLVSPTFFKSFTEQNTFKSLVTCIKQQIK
jgi:hypothetical protein